MNRKGRLDLSHLGAHSRAWLTHADRPVLGERHLAILEAVRESGSLNAAAKRLRMSYRDAWGKIREAERALGVALIDARVGGARGGGSRLTPTGEQVVERLRAFLHEHRHAATRSAALYFGSRPAPASAGANGDRLLLASTTSAVDTGLLAALLDPFEQRFGVTVEVLPVGSGAALRLARTGGADIVLTHAPAAEQHSVAAAETVNHRQIMTNEFVVVGPAADPANVRSARSMPTALRRIVAKGAPFLSRADGSGTNERERALFEGAAIERGAWYRSARCGMAELLRQANAVGAYALSDRGTFAALAGRLALEVLYDDDPDLWNAYGVLATNPHRHPAANYPAAMALIGWLTSPTAQELIAAYRIDGRIVAQPVRPGVRGRARRS